ncbi:lipase family protein [Actinomadura sp. HBU206391]|uniref:lipase family protein n=1 Tax=Actinomadura sp. HBU206391 TaxID=2731692 RepID=UPI0016508C36|nr:lipase family protein [Actinomadura sp. HBU206391]MBC6456435.1 lipase [Actinomadura sp. HBU206391]
MSARVRLGRAPAILVALIVVFSMAIPHRAATAADFYTPPSPLPSGNSGDVIRSERMNYKATIPALARAWRVLYLSTSATGQRIAVSGAVIVPVLPYGGPRPIIGYAPGSHGLGDQCAPSREIDAGTDTEASLISVLLARGWAVAVTDYEALGTPGDHTYMVGPSAGHAVLDVMRAATRLPGAGLSASAPMAVSGYSQGGGAVGWAAQLRGDYAPELPIKGIAAGGTPADLNAVAANLDGGPEFGYVAMAGIGFDAAYPELPFQELLTPEGRALFADIRDDCLSEIQSKLADRRMNEFTTVPDVLRLPAWQARLAESRLGGATPHVPMLLYHGLLDVTIPIAQAGTLRRAYCSRGVSVQWNVYPADHVGTAVLGAIPAGGWLSDRLAGRGAPTNC